MVEPAQQPLFRELVDAFFVARLPRKDSPHTTAAYRRDLRTIADLVARQVDADPVDLRISDFGLHSLRRAFADFAASRAKTSIARAWSTWNSFFSFLVTEGVVEGNPMVGVTRPRLPGQTPKPLQGESTPEQLLAALARGVRHGRDPWPERDLAIIATLLLTGVRTAELLSLNVGDVAGPPGERRLRVLGKGDVQRHIPIEPALDSLIEGYLQSRCRRLPAQPCPAPVHAPLFVGRSGDRLTRNALQYLVRSCYRWAGIYDRVERGTLVHALRHTFATRLGQTGASSMEIMELLGHKNLTTSQGYIKVTAREIREAAAANPTYRLVEELQRQTRQPPD